MKKLIWLPILFFGFILNSCDPEEDIIYPNVDPEGLMEHTISLTKNQIDLFEGVYKVLEGNSEFGDQVVLKYNGKSFSIFGYHFVLYMVLDAGRLDSLILFKGFWRHLNNHKTGAITFLIDSLPADNFLNKNLIDTSSILKGVFGNGSAIPEMNVKLQYIRPLSDRVKSMNFHILAHRGGGRNSDDLDASENSINMISKAEQLGATGVEIDVHISKDNIPFLYHDKDINLRLTQKNLLFGRIEDFTFPQVRANVRLKRGEEIPSLREALEFIVNETNLGMVWLDIKTERNIQPIIDLQREYLLSAQGLNRQLQILIGIPDEDQLNKLKTFPDYQNIPSLCEVSLDETNKLNSLVWAPRWTDGLLLDEVNKAHSSNKLVFTWTLDEPQYIEKYMKDGNFDGVLSNYSPLVAYYHYIRE